MEPPPHKEPFHLNLQKNGQGVDVMDSFHQSTFFRPMSLQPLQWDFVCNNFNALTWKDTNKGCRAGKSVGEVSLYPASETTSVAMHRHHCHAMLAIKKNYYCKHLWKPVMAPHTATLPYMAMFTSTAWKIINAVKCWLSTILCLSHSCPYKSSSGEQSLSCFLFFCFAAPEK